MENFFNNKSIQGLIDETMKNLHSIARANTIIGEPIVTPNNVVIVPISKVSVGYIVGGGEYTDLTKRKPQQYPMAGGSGGGLTLSPVGFLLCSTTGIEYLDIENKTAAENVLKILNKIVAKFTEEKHEKN